MHRRDWARVLVLCSLAACSTPPALPVDAAESDAGPTLGATVRFTLPSTGLPRPLDVPWPTDLYRADPDGTIVDTLSDWSVTDEGAGMAIFAAYGQLDGFGVLGGALFHVDGEALDATTLPTDETACAAAASQVGIVDLDPSGTPGAHVACGAAAMFVHGSLAVWPAARLEPGHRYAAYVTDAVRTMSGASLAASAELVAIRDSASGARASAAGAFYGDAIDRFVDATGIAREHLVGLAPFTTESLPTRLAHLRTQLLAEAAPPTLLASSARYPLLRFGASAHAGWSATLDALLGPAPTAADGSELPGIGGDAPQTGIAHAEIGAILHASFVSPRFTRDYRRRGTAEDGTIALDASLHASIVDASAEVPVYVMLPRSAPPPGGWPVVVFQHGLLQFASYGFALANELARAGIAMVAIDAPFHGLRAEGSTDTSAVQGPVASYQGADGAPDASSAITSIGFAGHLQNALAWRDNLFQAALDIVSLRRLVADPSLDLSSVADEWPGSTPQLDGTHVAYVGLSLGAVIGSLVATIEPRGEIDPFVLDVDGGDIYPSLSLAPATAQEWTLLASLVHLSRDAMDGPESPFVQLAEGLVDPADPLTVADAIVSGPDGAGHRVWLVGARWDESVPRTGSDALVRAVGALQITPTRRTIDGLSASASPLRPTGTSGFAAYFELDPASHVHLLARALNVSFGPGPMSGTPRYAPISPPFLRAQPIVGMQRALAHFLATSWAGASEIDVTSAPYADLTPVDDFDGDGFCDADETAAGTSPTDPASVPSGTPGCVRALGL